MANKIRRDDEVVVLAGKDKGKQGKDGEVFHGQVFNLQTKGADKEDGEEGNKT